MIRIKPYYNRSNSNEILTYYLNLVAAVVPFEPDDILFGEASPLFEIEKKPKKRTDAYKALLNKHTFPLTEDKDIQRQQDIELAEKIILDYSVDLHKKLYYGEELFTGRKVDKHALRELLTVTFIHGEIPKNIRDLLPPKSTNKDEKVKKAEDAILKEKAKALYKHVFCYDDFSKAKILQSGKKHNRLDIYHLVAMLGVEVCPYCNRQFTSTVVNGQKCLRPQLDHFRNKSDYPFLALSINNLVPCCAVCNLLKLDKDHDMLYPYDEGLDDNYVFQAECDKDNITSLLTGAKDAIQKFKLELKPKREILDNDYDTRVKTSRTNLAIDDLYQFHKEYVADLFEQRYILSKELFDDRKGQFPDLFKNAKKAHALRLMDYSQEKWGRRPLAKLTHDIAEQIDELYKDEENILAILSSIKNENI